VHSLENSQTNSSQTNTATRLLSRRRTPTLRCEWLPPDSERVARRLEGFSTLRRLRMETPQRGSRYANSLENSQTNSSQTNTASRLLSRRRTPTLRCEWLPPDSTVHSLGSTYLVLSALCNTQIDMILSAHFELAVELVQLHDMLVVVNVHARLILLAELDAWCDSKRLLLAGRVYKRQRRSNFHLVAQSFGDIAHPCFRMNLDNLKVIKRLAIHSWLCKASVHS